MDDATANQSVALVAASGAVLWALAGLLIIYLRMKAKNQGLGANNLKAIGVILLLPAIVLLAVTNGFQSETLAALMGTVAGYVLSRGGGGDGAGGGTGGG